LKRNEILQTGRISLRTQNLYVCNAFLFHDCAGHNGDYYDDYYDYDDNSDSIDNICNI